MQQAHADACSRLPLPESVLIPGDTILLIDHLNSTSVKAAQIGVWTQRDPVLSSVTRHVRQDWPSKPTNDAQKPYYNRREELSVEDNCLLWGNRVVILPQGRKLVLEELHVGHPGIEHMKRLARSYLWWPGLDGDIEQKVKTCIPCQNNRKLPSTAPMHPWEWPRAPWSRIHIDYLGPFLGKMCLLIVDSHSKWVEVHVTTSATTATTIDKLQTTFAALGLPEVIVSDNGPAFCSDEFRSFMKQNGIQHVKTPPYHPASNGLAERYVQVFKDGMRKLTGGSMESRVARFLSRYHTTPQSTTGTTPAELMFGRKLWTRLDLLKPDLEVAVRQKQTKQKVAHDYHATDRSFEEGASVYVHNQAGSPKWIPGTIVKKTGPGSYLVQLENSQKQLSRHQDHIRLCLAMAETQATSDHQGDYLDEMEDILPIFPPAGRTNVTPPSPPPLRRSQCIRHPPQRYI